MREDAAYLVTVEGAIEEIAPQNGTDFALVEAQTLVDGPVEVIRLSCGQIMIVHEEGKYCKEKNGIATRIALFEESIMPNDYICGNAVICPKEMFR